MEWTSFKGVDAWLPTRLDDEVISCVNYRTAIVHLSPGWTTTPSLARLPSARLFRFLHAPAGLDDEAIAAHPALRGRCVTAAAVSRQLLIDDSDASRPPR